MFMRASVIEEVANTCVDPKKEEYEYLHFQL